MQIKTITTALAALAFASDVAARLQPYKVQEVRMSTRQLFGVVRRDEPGYQPESAVCGTGNTCEEACGSGYQTCSSLDSKVHCFNKDAGQTCCPDKSGNSCDAGYYCTSDKSSGTWCCPDSMSLEECASEFKVDGGLVSQTPAAESTTSSSAASTSSSEATTSSSEAASSTSKAASTTVFSAQPSGITHSPSATFPASNTTSISSFSSPSPTISKLPESGANMAAPVSALLLIAGLAALL